MSEYPIGKDVGNFNVEMTENSQFGFDEKMNLLLSKLELPPSNELLKSDFKELHDLWRSNNKTLLDTLKLLDLKKFPYLGSHGTSKEGVNYLHDNAIPMSVWVNYKKPDSSDEALGILYSIVGSGVNHTHVSGAKDEIGGLVIVNLGTEESNLEKRLDKKVILSMQPMSPIDQYPVANDDAKEVEMGNWHWEQADDPDEVAMFQTALDLERSGGIAAAELSSKALNTGLLKYVVLQGRDLADYSSLHSNNEIMDGYVQAMALRIETQAAIVKILPDLLAD